MKRFFVGCNIHFEDELELELKEIWPFFIDLDGRAHATALNIVEKVPGGILIEAPLHLGLQINFYSKLANRVLLRIKEFRVRDFPKFFQTVNALKKDPFLMGHTFHYQVAAQESRLNNEKRLKEILVEVFGAENPDSEQALYVRMAQDQCSVSLDTTGLHLHKRSERTSQGAAPLRETLAAFCVRKLIGDSSAVELKDITLIDPMCGTGTMLREAQTLFTPTIRNDFAFLKWNQTPKILKSPSLRGNYPESLSLFAGFKAFDVDPAAIERVQESLQKSGASFEAKVQNLFQGAPEESKARNWVISNPPYGERIQADFTPLQLLKKIESAFHPEKVGLLLSERQAAQLSQNLDSALKLQSQWNFQNGGIGVKFLVFSKV